MSEDDGAEVRKEEMKKSIFMKRKSSVSPRSSDEKKSPDRKSSNHYSNPFSFTHAKKATNDIIQNEILKNEIMKRKTEELNKINKVSLQVCVKFNQKVPTKSMFFQDKPVKSMSYSSSSDTCSSSSNSSSEEDSDYEIHEVYQLKEWFPPDLAKKPDTNNTVTLIQSR